MDYSKHVGTRETSQSEPIFGKDMKQNSAGGFSFGVDDWKRLDRFLILGSEGGSYYAGERKLTRENAEGVLKCLKSDGVRVVRRVAEISDAGRAPKNDPAIFVLAMAIGLGDEATKREAALALPKVCRTGTHLFTFLENVKSFRKWGRGLRTAVGKWYSAADAEKLAYQLVKYRQRNGWTHRDVLRLCHVKPASKIQQSLFSWVTQGKTSEDLPKIITDFTALEAAKDEQEVIRILSENPSLPWESVPSQFLGSAKVWEVFLRHLPMTAMIRNLGRMTTNGLIQPMSEAAKTVAAQLGDVERLKKARVHPIALLAALTTYQNGHGARGGNSWEPVREVVDALDGAFYASFGNVPSTGKRWLLALDVSGSMGGGEVSGVPGLTPRVASAAMAMVTARTEPQYACVGFSQRLTPLDISPRQRLDDVLMTISGLPFEGTDCALPMVWALKRKMPVDTFVVYTDNETWAGNIHPSQALRKYREQMGIPAKLIVVGMVANEFTIADPDDAGMLDVVGFDTATPSVMADFAVE